MSSGVALMYHAFHFAACVCAPPASKPSDRRSCMSLMVGRRADTEYSPCKRANTTSGSHASPTSRDFGEADPFPPAAWLGPRCEVGIAPEVEVSSALASAVVIKPALRSAWTPRLKQNAGRWRLYNPRQTSSTPRRVTVRINDATRSAWDACVAVLSSSLSLMALTNIATNTFSENWAANSECHRHLARCRYYALGKQAWHPTWPHWKSISCCHAVPRICTHHEPPPNAVQHLQLQPALSSRGLQSLSCETAPPSSPSHPTTILRKCLATCCLVRARRVLCHLQQTIPCVLDKRTSRESASFLLR